MTLNEWVSRLMAEGPEDATSQDYFAQPSPNYIEQPRPAPATRYEAAGHPADEIGRVTQAIERLSDRIESAESRQALAIAGVERSVREVIARIDAGEREQMQLGARFEGGLQEIKAETSKLSDRLRRVEDEAAGPRSIEALRALEGAIGKVAGHVYEGERSTREAVGEIRGRVQRLDAAEQASLSAIRELKTSCAALDQRLSLAESGASESVERVAETLSARVEAAREELGRQLAAAADARFDRVEQALAQMSEHVRAAEQRSAGALERMGREVLEVAQTLHRRVQSVERGGTEAADRLGADVARIASAVEDRLIRSDSIHAQALEKLGGEIARITERLADRIANAERRSAQAIDDVGEQVARVTERIGQRHERSVGELADRIRQSEERTARLLEEARQKIDDRLAETQRRAAEPPPARPDELDDALFGDAPFPAFDAPPPERPFARSLPAAAFAPSVVAPRTEPAFEDEDFEAAAEIATPVPSEPPAPEPRPEPPSAEAAPQLEPDLEAVALEPNVGFDTDDDFVAPAASTPQAPTAEAPEPPPTGQLTTREIIDRARAAARAANERDGAPKPRPAAGHADETILEGLTFGRSRRGPGGPSGALMVASLLAALGLGAGGYVFFDDQAGGRLPQQVADAIARARAPAGAPAVSAQPSAPIAAVAFAPKPAADAQADVAGAYSKIVAKLTAGETGALGDLTRLATGGYAPAQFYLAELYQDGKSGLKKDPAESRRWLERAAEGGDRTAMHNLALDYHEGVGGARSAAQAAEWFRRAAELGLLDSQFNLAAIYEHGDGVSQNPAEAYKWYLIAARAGDAESRAGALRVRTGLTPDARAVAERAAAEFQPAPADAQAGVAPAAASSPDLVTAQRALNQLGYYQGPTDGVASPALHLALAAYQRDQGIPVTGAPDAATIGKLSVYTR